MDTKDIKEKKYFYQDGTVATWWKPSLRTEWIAYTEERLRLGDFRRGNFVLEVGGGDGRFGIPILYKGTTYVDVDLSRDMIKKMRKKVKQEGLLNSCYFILSDGSKLPLRENLFDRAICYATILHIPTQQDVVNELGRVTKPNGFFLIEFHNILHYIIFLTKVLNTIWGRKKDIVPYHPVTPLRAILYFKRAHARILDIKGFSVFFSFWLQKHPENCLSRFFMYGLKDSFLKWFGSGIIIKAEGIAHEKSVGE